MKKTLTGFILAAILIISSLVPAIGADGEEPLGNPNPDGSVTTEDPDGLVTAEDPESEEDAETDEPADGGLEDDALNPPEGEEELLEVAPPDDGGLYVALGGDETATVGGKAEYTVCAGNINKLATATIWFEVDGSYFSCEDVTGLGGFEFLDEIQWDPEDDSLWAGWVTLVAYDGGVTSDEPLDILKLTLNVKEKLGDTEVRIARVELSGYDESGEAVFFDVDLRADAVHTQVLLLSSPYDVNRDGEIDQLDLTTGQLSYAAAEEEDGWEDGRIADVNGDGRVDIADLILIIGNIIW